MRAPSVNGISALLPPEASNRFYYKKLLLPVTLRAPGCESGAWNVPGCCNFRTAGATIIFHPGAARVYTMRGCVIVTEGA
jgi:hypothetical protein